MTDTDVLPDEQYDSETVVCPWCEYRHCDGWEMVDFGTERPTDGECENCGKPIRYRGEISHTYTCEAILPEDQS